jgi:hypothetical protein
MIRPIQIAFVPAIVAALSATACRAVERGRAAEQASVYIKVEAIGSDGKPCVRTGSGVCVAPDGLVVTNQHVIRLANTIRVVFHAATADEYESAAEVIGVHPDRDLALLQCRAERAAAWIPLGSTRDLQLTDGVRCAGFPLGGWMADGNRNPSVSISVGSVASLRKNADGRLCWIDVGAPVAGGNSGSAVLDEASQLIGILTQRYESFGRATPVEYVKELLGAAALDVRFDPAVAPEDGGPVDVVVKPQGPVSDLLHGLVWIPDQDQRPIRLKPAGNTLIAKLRAPPRQDGQPQLPIVVQATTPDGLGWERVVGLNRLERPPVAIRGIIDSITLQRLKANGWRWDADAPDQFCNLYVNGLLVKQTDAVRNQYRFLTETAFDCQAGDSVRIVVFDKDLSRHDLAGEICFTAEPGLTVTRPTAGELQDCEITLRAVPLRPVSLE